MPTETPNRPSRIGLEKCFPEREWPKTHIPLVTESGPGRRRWTAPPRQAKAAKNPKPERVFSERSEETLSCPPQALKFLR